METNVDEGEAVPIYGDEKESYNEPPEVTDLTWFYSLVICFEILCVSVFGLLVHWGTEYFGGYGWDGTGLMFNWHPLLMVFGMIILFGNAAISYRVFRNYGKFEIKLLHAALQALAFIFAVIGLFAVFGFHNHNKIPNMYSLHSWIGMSTVILFGCQYLFGFLGFLFPKFGENNRAAYLHIHVFFGVAILVMAVVACVSGFTEKMIFSSSKYPYSSFPAAGNIANVLGMMITLIAMIVGYIMYNPQYKRVEPYQSID